MDRGDDRARRMAQLPERVLRLRIQRERAPRSLRTGGTPPRSRSATRSASARELASTSPSSTASASSGAGTTVPPWRATSRKLRSSSSHATAPARRARSAAITASSSVANAPSRLAECRSERREPQLEPDDERERPFAPDHEIDDVAGRRPIGEPVPRRVLAHAGVSRRRAALGGEHGRERIERASENRQRRRRGSAAQLAPRAVAEDAVQRLHPDAHRAVAERVGAGGVRGRHAADGAERAARRIDGEPQADARAPRDRPRRAPRPARSESCGARRRRARSRRAGSDRR